MSKNRLLQIVNRLGLTPKDKTDLVDIINEGGIGSSENEEVKDFDYWNLENNPIYLQSNHKIYKHTAEEIIEKEEIIDDLGENSFNNILFYYTLGTSIETNLVYKTFDRRQLLNGISINGCNISLNDNTTLKITNKGVKVGYIQYQPYTNINKLPKIFYEDSGDIPIINVYSESINLPLYQLFKVVNFEFSKYIKINKNPLLIMDADNFRVYNIDNMSDDGYIEDYFVGYFYGSNNFYSFDIAFPYDNINILQHIDFRNYCLCNIINTRNNIIILSNAEYYNGIITGIKEGKLVQYDVNFETGEITLKQTTDLELIASEVKLDVCTAGSTEAARNLELLNKAYFALGDHFTVNIDAGIGVAKFIPETGGEGHITTAEGVNVHYTIGADGSVVKTMEIDIVALYNKVESMSINE